MNVLVVNCYLDERLIREFELEMKRNLVLPDERVELTFVRPQSGLPIDTEDFSRMIVSGSEASAREDNSWDEPLDTLINSFVAASRPVLGICYGHQFMIRTLVGRNHVRARDKRVWGWLALDLAESPIFEGLAQIVAVTCNSNEVFDLPSEYRVLTAAEHCRVLAYEHREKPVWGVQFHPEYERRYGDVVLEAVTGVVDRLSYTYRDQCRSDGDLTMNRQLFANFLKI